MSSPATPLSQAGRPTQNGMVESDNLTMATSNANVSLNKPIRVKDGPPQMALTYEQHVFALVTAYSEVDVLAMSVCVSQEVAIHAKALYSQVYNFSDFEEQLFHHEVLIAACLYIACRDKNQHRTMPEVFKSTHATTQQKLGVYETLKPFFMALHEVLTPPSEVDHHLAAAFRYAISFSASSSIPPRASNYAMRLYKQIHASNIFQHKDQKILVLSCLFIACRQFNVTRTFREIFAMDPGATKPDIRRVYSSIEPFFRAQNKRKTEKARKGTAKATNSDAHSNDQVLHTLQELVEQLTFEERPVSINERGTVVNAPFAPTALAPASMGIEVDNDIDMDASTAPAPPFVANTTHAFNKFADHNAISTIPPTALAPIASRKNALATRNTLYNVICCKCGKILNLQNIHYAFYCLNCHHKRCDNCPMQAI